MDTRETSAIGRSYAKYENRQTEGCSSMPRSSDAIGSCLPSVYHSAVDGIRLTRLEVINTPLHTIATHRGRWRSV